MSDDRIRVFEIAGDVPRIVDPVIAVDEHGNSILVAEGNGRAVAKGNRDAFETVQTFMFGRHQSPPAKWAEPDIVDPIELEHRDCHAFPQKFEFGFALGSVSIAPPSSRVVAGFATGESIEQIQHAPTPVKDGIVGL